MASKLWEKNFEINKEIERFTVGSDREMDLYLAKYDVMGSMAHIIMLESIGLLGRDELPRLLTELRDIYDTCERGEFVIEDGVEDVHSQVELMLTRRLGDMGKKIHSGRSRNDQVLVDLKLFTRHELKEVALAVVKLFDELIAKSDRYNNVLMPGYQPQPARRGGRLRLAVPAGPRNDHPPARFRINGLQRGLCPDGPRQDRTQRGLCHGLGCRHTVKTGFRRLSVQQSELLVRESAQGMHHRELDNATQEESRRVRTDTCQKQQATGTAAADSADNEQSANRIFPRPSNHKRGIPAGFHRVERLSCHGCMDYQPHRGQLAHTGQSYIRPYVLRGGGEPSGGFGHAVPRCLQDRGTGD